MLLHADDLGNGAQGDVKRINFHNHSIAVKQIKIDDLNLFKQALKELHVLRK
uniref:Uncharacterized protein n=1 Tax=Acrobeloides nanus TaxID=290746 RepID=A0A914D9C9_9BILA